MGQSRRFALLSQNRAERITVSRRSHRRAPAIALDQSLSEHLHIWIMKASSIAVLLLATICNLPLTEGFSLVHKTNSHAMTSLSLHPDQAKELEACAFALTKDYVVTKSSSGRRRSAKGPFVSIRRLWTGGFYPSDEYERPSASTASKALGSKKP
jgi:hypothetical protein